MILNNDDINNINNNNININNINNGDGEYNISKVIVILCIDD